MSKLENYNGIAARSSFQATATARAIAENKREYITLNIGLENNSLAAAYVVCYTGVLFDSQAHSHRIENGTYNGELERTLIIKLYVKSDMITIQTKLRLLALALDQECIALQYSDGISALVYSPIYDGEKQAFNNDYFLTIGAAK